MGELGRGEKGERALPLAFSACLGLGREGEEPRGGERVVGRGREGGREGEAGAGRGWDVTHLEWCQRERREREERRGRTEE